MSNTIKKPLTKKDFCKPDCSCDGWGDLIYPETSIDQIQYGSITLDQWLAGGNSYETIIQLIEDYIPAPCGWPTIASATNLGGIKVGTGLQIDANGVLSVIGGGGGGAIVLPVARNTQLGGVKLFSDAEIPVNATCAWDSWVIPDTNNEINLVDVESSETLRALPIYTTTQTLGTTAYDSLKPYIYAVIPESWLPIPTNYHAGDYIDFKEHEDYYSINGCEWILDYYLNPVNDADLEIDEGSGLHQNEFNYLFLGNKTLRNGNGNTGTDNNVNVSLDYGFPRFALASANGIVFKVNQGQSSFATNPWDSLTGYDQTIDELIIGLNTASASEIGGILLGYTQNADKYPIYVDQDGRAYVQVPQVQIINSLSTHSLSMHYFAINYNIGGASGGIKVEAGEYIPLIESISTNNEKRQLIFEIIGREDSKTYYGKYMFNSVNTSAGLETKLVCLDFYSDNEGLFSHSDIVAVKNSSTVTIYKLNHLAFQDHNAACEFFIINVLAENDSSYSTQHYYYTSNKSTIQETGYNNPTPASTLSSIINSETYNTHSVSTLSSATKTLDVKANQKYVFSITQDTDFTISSIEDSRYESIIVVKSVVASTDVPVPTFTFPSDTIIIDNTSLAFSDGVTRNDRVVYISHNIVRIDKC